MLELALQESRALGHNYIGTEHILLALIREGDGVAAHVLSDLGADLDGTREQVLGDVIEPLCGVACGLDGIDGQVAEAGPSGRRARYREACVAATVIVGKATPMRMVWL